jgi:hypothetical protein
MYILLHRNHTKVQLKLQAPAVPAPMCVLHHNVEWRQLPQKQRLR